MDIRKDDILEYMKAEGILMKDAEKVLGVFCRYVADRLKEGDSIHLSRFGIWKRRLVTERMARIPNTGERVRVEEHYLVRFYPSKSLNDYVNGGQE